MEHSFRKSSKGDMLDVKHAMRDLKQQLNDIEHSNKLLHTENQRLKQHIKGLECVLVNNHQTSAARSSSATGGTLYTSLDNRIASTAAAAWSGQVSIRASTAPGGTLRASMAGGSSSARAFTKAAHAAQQQASKASADLLTAKKQVEQLQQQLQQLSCKHNQLLTSHNQLQAAHAAMQQQAAACNEAHSSTVLRLETDKAALQEQLQQIQQVLSSKQQDVVEQLKKQQTEQLIANAEHQQQLQQLRADHAKQLEQLQHQLQQEQAVAQGRAVAVEAELARCKALVHQLANLEWHAAPAGWTCQEAYLHPVVVQDSRAVNDIKQCEQLQSQENQQRNSCGQQNQQGGQHYATGEGRSLLPSASQHAAVDQAAAIGTVHDHGNKHGAQLQLLLYSISSQPGMLGISRQHWWPMVLVHAVTGSNSHCGGETQTRSSCQQLLAAATGREAAEICVANSSNKQSSKPSDEHSMHHQLQIHLPWSTAVAAGRRDTLWLQHGQLQLSLVNAHAAVVGLFRVPRNTIRQCNGSQSKDSRCMSGVLSINTSTAQQQGALLVLAVMLAVSKSCWVLGLYQLAHDGRPGAWLGVLSQEGADWCSWLSSDVPDLQAGQVLVPISSAGDSTSSSSLSSSCCVIQQCNMTELHRAAQASKLFTNTGQHVVVPAARHQQQHTCVNTSKGGVGCGGGVVCEVWQLQPAAARAAASQAWAGKEKAVAQQPWLGAMDVLATATLPFSTAATTPTAAEAAAQTRKRLLAPYAGGDSLAVLPDQPTVVSSDSNYAYGGGDCSVVELVHARGKQVAQLQAVLRYCHHFVA